MKTVVSWASIGALMWAIVLTFSTTLQSQISNPQVQGIILKANDATLCALIGKKQTIGFSYYYDPEDADQRILQPYAVGYSNNNLFLFGRQTFGYSKSVQEDRGEIPGWRNFRIDEIKMGIVNALASTFEPVRPNPAETRAIIKYICKIDWSTAPEETAQWRPNRQNILVRPGRPLRRRAAASTAPTTAPLPDTASSPPETTPPKTGLSTYPISKPSAGSPPSDRLTEIERANQEGWMAIPYDRRPHRSIEWYRQHAPPRTQTLPVGSESGQQ
jgi:hypothetical protein